MRPLRDKSRGDHNELFWEGWSRLLSTGKTPDRAALLGKPALPESEGRASREENGFRFGLWFLIEAKEGVIFHTDFPEDFTAVSAGHQKVQRVLIWALRETKTSEKSKHGHILHFTTRFWGLTLRSGRSLMRKRFLLKLSLRTLAQLKELIFVWPCSDLQTVNFNDAIYRTHSTKHALCRPADALDWPEKPERRCAPHSDWAWSPPDPWLDGGESRTSPTCVQPRATDSRILLVFGL